MPGTLGFVLESKRCGVSGFIRTPFSRAQSAATTTALRITLLRIGRGTLEGKCL